MENIINCDEAAEFISALYDGETIPRAAAEHIASCLSCKVRLKEYIEMGVELRRVASLDSSTEVKHRTWDKQSRTMRIWWEKGWETMRIPRFAFALLLTVVVALSSGLTLIGVRAHTRGSVAMLKIEVDPEHINPCPLSIEDKNYWDCGWSGGANSGKLSYKIKLLSKDANRIHLGIQTSFKKDANTSSETSKSLQSTPAKEYWFEPGKKLQVDVAGLGPLTLTGEWLDHMPYFARMDLEHNLVPGPNELRVISPVLLCGDRVVEDFKRGSVIADEPDDAFWMYVPADGVYVLSLSPMANAVPGQVENNRVSFEIAGKTYQFVTGAPIARDQPVWVLHLPGAKSPWGDSTHAILGAEKLDHLLASLQAKN